MLVCEYKNNSRAINTLCQSKVKAFIKDEVLNGVKSSLINKQLVITADVSNITTQIQVDCRVAGLEITHNLLVLSNNR